MIELSKIRIDGGTQQREQLNEDVVAEYAEAMKSGAKFPAVTVFYDGAVYWLADGFHRFFAAKSAGLSKIAENVIPGTSRDARLFSFGVNADHGLRRTNADKRKIVLAMLEDTEWSGWSDNAIAKACHVSHTFVSNLRHVTCNVASEKPTEKTYTTKHGTTATMDTANIGKVVPLPPTKIEISTGELAELRAENERLKEWGSENAATAKEMLAENESLSAIFDQDDKLAASIAECKKLREMNRILEERMRGLMNEKNEAIRAAKSWQRKYEQAMKAA